MALILCLETATKNCSVSLSWEGDLLAVKELSSDQYLHSEKLHVFIQEVFEQSGKSIQHLSAVAVSKGPGSYTGLRIGVSAAKGLCYALKIPLIAIDTLDILAKAYLNEHTLDENELLIPMLDARRMEVYCAVYNYRGEALTKVEAKVIDNSSFSDLKAENIHLIGDGAAKSLEVLMGNKRFKDGHLAEPSAKDMVLLAYSSYMAKQFQDLAYFEPFYLKNFIAGKPKSLL